MSLVWHIAKKDLRRLALPVGLWCLFILVTALWFRTAGPSEVHGDADINIWLTLIRDFGWIVVGGQFVVGYVLAGALLIEDAPTGTTGFWLTRPMSGARVARAKLLAAALLFVVAPILVLTPVWLASGFGVAELARAQWAFGWSHAPLTVCALAVASLARDLAGFLFRTVIVGAAWTACAYVGAMRSNPGVPAIEQSRMMVAGIASVVVLLATFVQQFVVRHNRRASLTIGGGLIGCLVLRMAWPWDLTRSLDRSDARPDDRAVQITTETSLRTFTRSENEGPFLDVTTPWRKEGFYAPIGIWTAGNLPVMELESRWDRPGLRALGLDADAGALGWQLFVTNSRQAAAKIVGRLEVWFMRARVVGEMPVKDSAQLLDGSSRTRIVGFARENGRLDAIYLQENEFALPAASRIKARGTDSAGRYFEQFLLVDRATHQSLALSAGGLESVELNSQHLGFRRLSVPGEHDWSNGVLVKVVFERDHRFWRPIEVNGVTADNPKP